MQSQFNRQRRVIATSTPSVDETYDLKGLNLIAPDQVTPKGESPYTINSRAYARDSEDTRVAIRTRKGSQYLSAPLGEAENVTNEATSTGDVEFSASKWLIQPFVPDADGALTKVDLELKKTGPASGHIIVEIYSDNGMGGLGELLAQSSVLGSVVTSSYSWLDAKFMDAPELASGSTYWKLIKVQAYGTGVYALNMTAGSDAKYSEDELETATGVGGNFRYKTYLSTPGEIIGFARRYPQDKTNRTFFAFKDGTTTTLYEVTDAGVATVVDADLDVDAQAFRSAQVDDKLFYLDTEGRAKVYDGDDVAILNGISDEQFLVIVFKNRLMFVPKSDPTRVNFSALYSFESYPSVNFFYVPNPKSPDHISGWRVFQDNLVIWTHETKHIVYGSDISSFTRKEAIGTKGAVSDEAIAVDRNYAYFMADDGMIYRWNGATDELISSKIEPELNRIQDRKKVRFHIYRNQLRVYYAEKPNTIATRMLLFDIDTEQWFMDTGRSVMGSMEWYLNDNELIEFSSRTGQMFLGEAGESDMGKAINFKYWTAYKAYASGASKDRIKRFRPIVRPTGTPYYLMVGKSVDLNDTVANMRPWLVDNGGAKWGSFSWADGTKWGTGKQMIDNTAPMSGRAKHTQYRFECDQVETPVQLYGYIALVKSGRVR